MQTEPQIALKRVLDKKGLTQYQFAKRLGVNPNAVSRQIKSTYDPKFSTLKRWAKILEVPVATFIEEKAPVVAKSATTKSATQKKVTKSATTKPATQKKVAKSATAKPSTQKKDAKVKAAAPKTAVKKTASKTAKPAGKKVTQKAK